MTYSKNISLSFFLIAVPLLLNANEKYEVTATRLNIRNGPGTEYAVITQLEKGEIITVVKKSNSGWYEIETSKGAGYVAANYIMDIDDSLSWWNKIPNGIKHGIFIAILIIIIWMLIPRKKSDNKLTYGKPNMEISEMKSKPIVSVSKTTKNVGMAVFMAIMFPYLGVLYATVSGFFWLVFTFIGMWILILIDRSESAIRLGLFLSVVHFFVSIIWAGIAASNYNKRILRMPTN